MTVSAAALSAGLTVYAHPAQAQCALDTNTATCTGLLPEGIQNPNLFTVPPVDSLIIRDLTADIKLDENVADEPAAIFYRAEFSNAQTIALDVDLGQFAIRNNQTRAGALGVGVTVQESDLNASVTGDIFTTAVSEGYGIAAASAVTGDITLTSVGRRETLGTFSHAVYAVGVDSFAFANVGGDDIIIIDEIGNTIGVPQPNLSDIDITLDHSGNILTTGNGADGVRAIAGVSTLTIDVDGLIETRGDGAAAVRAQGTAANVFLTSTGNRLTSGIQSGGLLAATLGDGGVNITNTGNITTNGADAFGIAGQVGNDGGITIISEGDITTSGAGADGIFASLARSGDLEIASTGDILANGAGASAVDLVTTTGGIQFINEGALSGAGGSKAAVFAQTVDGDIAVQNLGAVVSIDETADAVFLSALNSGNVLYVATGDVTPSATGGRGVALQTASGNANISLSGNVIAGGGDALFANTLGDGNVSINVGGNITAGTNANAHAARAFTGANGSASVFTSGTVIGGRGSSNAPALASNVNGDGTASITTKAGLVIKS